MEPGKRRAFIAMPHYNEDMFHFLGRVFAGGRTPLTEAEACGVMSVVTRAARRLWCAGVMVTDIKASNVMVHYRGAGRRISIRLVDHGCFKDRTEMDAYNTTFCPPEHVHYFADSNANVPCEEAAVVWQLGILLMHVLQPALQYSSPDTYGDLFNQWTQSARLGTAMRGWPDREAFMRTMWGHVQWAMRTVVRDRCVGEAAKGALRYALRADGVLCRPTIAGFAACLEGS